MILFRVNVTVNRCGSLIFDVALKFTSVVAEEDTISIIQNATKDGKLGELSLNVSHIVGISRFPRTTTTAPTSTTPKSDGLFLLQIVVLLILEFVICLPVTLL